MRSLRVFRRFPAVRADAVVAVLALALTGAACQSTEHHFRNRGWICLLPEGTTLTDLALEKGALRSYAADRSLEVSVVMPDCLSSSCSFDESARCTAAVSGNRIDVESSGFFRDSAGTCTLDCELLAAGCRTGPLSPGTYQVRHGEVTLALTVPSMVAAPCGGRGIGF